VAIDAKAVLEQLGNPADVDRELQSFRKAARVLSSQRARLIDRYPKQWVAVYDGKVRAQGRTLQAVMKQIEKEGLPREHTVVRFIDKTRRTMIL
jgi:hypothetical protein